jgi:hypothetical protein
VIAAALLAAVPAFAGQYGPGPESFPGVGHFVFRNEAEAIARKVAATRGLSEPVNVVEVHVEQTSMTPGGRGWSVVVVGKIIGGCHAVTVGLAADNGRVYAVGDRRALPEKAPPDCERWYIDGAAGASATISTAPVAPAPVATLKAPGKGARIVSVDDAVRIAGAQAMKKGYVAPESVLSEFRAGVGGAPGVWRVDLLGMTAKGCGIFKLELAEPDWKMRFQNSQMGGKDVRLEECRAWYAKDGGTDDPMDWLPGKVEWETVDSNNLQ